MPNCKDVLNKNKNPAPGQYEKEEASAKRAVSADAASQNPAMNFLTNTKRDVRARPNRRAAGLLGQ